MRQLQYRIVLTENCNASCKHCFNADVREGNIMDHELFIGFMEEHREHLSTKTLKIMGGEPTTHPNFIDIVKEACKYFQTVLVFTNGIKLNEVVRDPYMMRNHFENRLGYVINGYTFNLEKFKGYLDFINIVNLHFVLTMNDTDKIVDKALEAAKEVYPKVHIEYSADTQVNLFDDSEMTRYREVWMDAMLKLLPGLSNMGASFSPDHTLPICFFTQEMLSVLDEHGFVNIDKSLTCCNCDAIGLIDWNFDLYFCNQTRIKLGSLLNEAGGFKPMEDILKMIEGSPKLKVDLLKDISDKCNNCSCIATCKAGCYYNRLFLSKCLSK